MGEVETVVCWENDDPVAITETWWDDSCIWNTGFENYKLFRRDKQDRGGGGEGAAFGKRRQETNVAKQPEDLLVGLREKKEKYMQWEQGCCQHVQGWNLER